MRTDQADTRTAALPDAIGSIGTISTISDVERDTGLAKETLRVWERRYDFPQPLRDAHGERAYPEEQVRKLRLVKRLLDLGFRPGKIMQHNTDELRALAERSAGEAPHAALHPDARLRNLFDLCKTHQIDALRLGLTEALRLLGLRAFVIDLAAPLTNLVEAAWAAGQLAVFEEHLYQEALHIVLRHAIFSLPPHQEGAPRILLTTLTQERRGLGLLMAEALCRLDGAHCISLGVQTPLADIVEAARCQHADIIALSFSGTLNPRLAIDALSELRARLPRSTELWAGGNCQGLKKRVPAFVQLLELPQLTGALVYWGRRNPAPRPLMLPIEQ